MDEYNDFDEFFDEDGNLVSTSWKREEEKREKQKEELAKKEAEKKIRLEMKRRVAMDDSQAAFFEEHEKKQQERSIRAEWMSMPSWIKAMPRVSLSEPPTEGRMNIIKYNVTGKVELTQAEEARRKKALGRIKMAINDHKRINQDFPLDHLSPVCVVGVGTSSGMGTSTVTHCILQALNDSRPSPEVLLGVDYGDTENIFSELYSSGNDQQIFLLHVMRWIRNKDDAIDSSMLPSALSSGRIKFLANRSSPRRREDVTIESIAMLYKHFRNERGFMVTDHDLQELEGVQAGIAMCATPVFVLPIERNASETLSNVLGMVRETMGEGKYAQVTQRGVIVTVATTPELSSGEGAKMVEAFTDSVAERCDMNKERIIHIPYDPALVKRPIPWRKTLFATQHMVRKICGFIVDDAQEDAHF